MLTNYQNTADIDPRIKQIEKQAEITYEYNKQKQKQQTIEQQKLQQLNSLYLQKSPNQTQQQFKNQHLLNDDKIDILRLSHQNFHQNNQQNNNPQQQQQNINNSQIPKYKLMDLDAQFFRTQQQDNQQQWEQDTELDWESNTIKYDEDFDQFNQNQNNFQNKNSDFNFFIQSKSQTQKQQTKHIINLQNSQQFQTKNKNNLLSYHKHQQQPKKNCKSCDTQLAFFKQKDSSQSLNEQINKVLLQSKILLNNQRYQEAETLLSDFTNIEHSDILYMVGETKRLLGKLKDAEFYLLQGLQYHTHSPYIFNSLGLVYLDIQAYPRAHLLLKKYLEINSQDSKANFNLGRCLVNLKNYTEAALFFSKAIEIDPQEPYYYLHRADCYEILGFTELSCQDFRKFKQLKPDYLPILKQQLQNFQLYKDQNSAQTIQNYINKLNQY